MSSSRRIACKICRDRKVRCDGEQPCARCIRGAERCVYSSNHNPTKADLIQTIEGLKARVDRTEARLVGQPLTTGNENLEITIPVTTIDNNDSDFAPVSMSMQSAIINNEHLQPSALQPWTHFADPFESHIHDSLSVSQLSNRNDEPLSQISLPTSPDRTYGLSLSRDHGHWPRMPSLREVRALNTPPQTAVRSFACENCEQLEECRNMVGQLTSLCSTLLVTQMETAGISSAVAEYLIWVRNGLRVPPEGANAETSDTEILEVLLARCHELQSMAETSHQAGMEQMSKLVQGPDSSMQLGDSKEAILMQMERRRRLFQDNYDICMALPEQLSVGQDSD